MWWRQRGLLIKGDVENGEGTRHVLELYLVPWPSAVLEQGLETLISLPSTTNSGSVSCILLTRFGSAEDKRTWQPQHVACGQPNWTGPLDWSQKSLGKSGSQRSKWWSKNLLPERWRKTWTFLYRGVAVLFFQAGSVLELHLVVWTLVEYFIARTKHLLKYCSFGTLFVLLLLLVLLSTAIFENDMPVSTCWN